MFKTLSSKSVYKNKWMEVFEDEVEYPNGTKGIYGYVKRSDGASVAVVNQNNEILLIKQYRYPTKAYEWNVPGGGLDGDDPEVAARRELKEEAGIEVNHLELLIEAYPLSSLSTEKGYVYLARVENIELVKEDVSDGDELIVEKKFVPIEEAVRMVEAGEISDADTCCVVLMVGRRVG
jgi:8-oxo-dGTP pyrophosphatase MutT (NUDIX family)